MKISIAKIELESYFLFPSLFLIFDCVIIADIKTNKKLMGTKDKDAIEPKKPIQKKYPLFNFFLFLHILLKQTIIKAKKQKSTLLLFLSHILDLNSNLYEAQLKYSLYKELLLLFLTLLKIIQVFHFEIF